MYSLFALASLLGAAVAAPSTCHQTSNWPGWSKIKHAFLFGDSYTTVSFNATLAQPSAANPIGNPPYPGWTASNGPNWADFITAKYNESLVLTYNLAYGGATVDSTLVAPYLPTVLSVEQQVDDEFVPIYGTASYNGVAPWTSTDSLFGIFIGINDVGNTYGKGPAGTAAINSKIFAEYQGLMETLYYAGARNFLFLNVPPTDRSPLVVGQGATAVALDKADIALFNGMITTLASTLKTQHSETNVFTVDTNTIFTQVLNNPKSYPQTAGYKNLTNYCVAYENGTPAEDTYDSSCGVPVNEYFWLNSLHPTSPMHDALASEVARRLRAGPNVC